VGILGADVAVTTKVFAAITGQQAAGRPATVRLGAARPQIEHPHIQPAVAAVLRAALARLAGAFSVVDVDGAPLTEIAGTLDDILLWEAWQVHRAQVESHPERYGPETLRLLRTASTVSEDAYRAAVRRRQELLPRAAEVYAQADVLVTPAAPFTAPVTTPPVDTPQGADEGLFTAVFNVTGDPALVLPCGWADDGLPVGIQLSAPRGADMQLLAAAALVEETLAFDRRPPAVIPRASGEERS
jgi:Asp-tRNA(Asn)/Glu-tRNA(Gln) amidotransferase A subunit family amidase